MRTRSLAFGGVFALALSSLTAAAIALPVPPDTPAPPPPVTDPASVHLYTYDGPDKAKQDGVTLRTKGDTTVRTATITYAPGSASGWHAHPGIVLAVVREGAIVRRVGCTQQKFVAGDAFTEVEPHNVSNFYVDPADPAAVDAVIDVTQIYPVGDQPRVPETAPTCPPKGHGKGGY